MNDSYYGESLYHPSENIEAAAPDASSPVMNSDAFADKVPVDAALVHETAMGGTMAAVGPLNGSLAAETPLYETPLQEIPMGGTVAAVGPMDEPPVNETPAYETPVQETIGETVVTDIPMDEPFTARTPFYSTPSQAVPMGGTIAPFGSMNRPLADERVPMYETPVEEIKMEETVAEFVAPVEQTSAPEAPLAETIAHDTPIATTAVSSVALINHEDAEHFRTHWNAIQGTFVDEPRTAVQQADALVSEVVEHITQMFAKEHSALEVQWNQGNDVSTEDLRKALQHYRSFFNRLVI